MRAELASVFKWVTCVHISFYSREPKNGFKFPLKEFGINELLAPILINAKLKVSFGCYENTSDVIIAESAFDYPLTDWWLRIFGCHDTICDAVSYQLLTVGLPRLREWYLDSNIKLLDEHNRWQCFTLTIRYENGELLFFS